MLYCAFLTPDLNLPVVATIDDHWVWKWHPTHSSVLQMLVDEFETYRVLTLQVLYLHRRHTFPVVWIPFSQNCRVSLLCSTQQNIGTYVYCLLPNAVNFVGWCQTSGTPNCSTNVPLSVMNTRTCCSTFLWCTFTCFTFLSFFRIQTEKTVLWGACLSGQILPLVAVGSFNHCKP